MHGFAWMSNIFLIASFTSSSDSSFLHTSLEDYDIGEESFNESAWQNHQRDLISGNICRTTCDTAAGYATGMCAGVAAFGAPMACLSQALVGVPCAVAQGLLWGLSSYCTSSAVFRTCELCGPGASFSDIVAAQLRVHSHLENVSHAFRGIVKARDEMQEWALRWDSLGEELDFKLRNEMHFADVDHLLRVMSDIEFDKDLPGVPIDNFALTMFNRTVLSPSGHGLLNLINQMHRLMAGGGISRHFGGQKSIFEIEKRFCQLAHLEQLEMTLLSLYQAFFFAIKLSGCDEDETLVFQNVFAEKREKQREHIGKVCNL